MAKFITHNQIVTGFKGVNIFSFEECAQYHQSSLQMYRVLCQTLSAYSFVAHNSGNLFLANALLFKLLILGVQSKFF